MKTILEQIADSKREEIAALKRRYSLSDFETMDAFQLPTRSLLDALKQSQFSIIAEFKRKSPSSGEINSKSSPIAQAQLYETSEAAAISCLTDSPYFGGSLEDLLVIRENVSIPVLRKDFILDEIQIFQAKAFGADAILLISELLESEHARQLTIIAQSLGMEVLMEAHDRKYLERINEFVDIIGINNRNLHLQKIDLNTSIQLADYLPRHKICISESGIKTAEDLELLENSGYRGALIGESLMKASNSDLIYRSPLKQTVS